MKNKQRYLLILIVYPPGKQVTLMLTNYIKNVGLFLSPSPSAGNLSLSIAYDEFRTGFMSRSHSIELQPVRFRPIGYYPMPQMQRKEVELFFKP